MSIVSLLSQTQPVSLIRIFQFCISYRAVLLLLCVAYIACTQAFPSFFNVEKHGKARPGYKAVCVLLSMCVWGGACVCVYVCVCVCTVCLCILACIDWSPLVGNYIPTPCVSSPTWNSSPFH